VLASAPTAFTQSSTMASSERDDLCSLRSASDSNPGKSFTGAVLGGIPQPQPQIDAEVDAFEQHKRRSAVLK
jgi:hypothetical protein